MAKRIFDIAIACIALLLLLPFLILVALWVRIDSAGPAFFRQVRVGRDGRTFRIFKFRTMRVDAESVGPQVTSHQDARITRAGHKLRRYKIDELPQFLNVLIGDMSVVGPRPEVPRYVAIYSEEQRRVVLSVRPGITDLASIVYRDENRLLDSSADPEATYIEIVMPAKLSLCIDYVNSRTFLGDIAIVARTLKAALFPASR